MGDGPGRPPFPFSFVSPPPPPTVQTVPEDDVDMDEAPELVAVPKEKPQPEIDEDGFTKVTRKKR